MKIKHLLFSILGIFLFLVCEQVSEGLEPDLPVEEPTTVESLVITKVVFSGYV